MVVNPLKPTIGLENLLNLDGEINGYWTKFEVRRVTLSAQMPHGIRYSLTLHDRNNTRVLGYDNAHAVKASRKKFGAVKTTWDHAHRMNKVEPYEFESAEQLLEDFWNEVDRFVN
ncbi:MAG: DUF6516 family protein [Geobacteraceae bacterium]|nr:DUF6516 family protein [Geobacteraceae bacterium]